MPNGQTQLGQTFDPGRFRPTSGLGRFSPVGQFAGKRQVGFLRGQAERGERVGRLAKFQSEARKQRVTAGAQRGREEIFRNVEEQREDVLRARRLASEDVKRVIDLSTDALARLERQFKRAREGSRERLAELIGTSGLVQNIESLGEIGGGIVSTGFVQNFLQGIGPTVQQQPLSFQPTGQPFAGSPQEFFAGQPSAIAPPPQVAGPSGDIQELFNPLFGRFGGAVGPVTSAQFARRF